MKILEPPRTNGHAKVTAEQIPQKKKRFSRRTLAIAAGALAVVIAAVAFFLLRPKPAASYVTQPVRQNALTQTVTATGTVNPQNTINVGTQVSGTISEVDVDFNSHVKKGQVLAKLDSTSLVAALNSARAQLAQSEAQAAAGASNAQSAGAGATAAQANVAAAQAGVASAQSQIAKAQAASSLAQQTVARDKQLLSQGYIAQATVDADQSAAVAAQAALSAAQIGIQQAQAQAQAQVASAAASRASAAGSGSSAAASAAAIDIQRAQVQQAEYNLSHSVITSPVDGTVISRGVSVGVTVAASFQTPTLFAIAQDLTKMELDLQVGEPDIGSLHAGDEVNFTVLAFPTRTFTAKVTQVRQSPTIVSNVVTYTTVVLVDNTDGALRPGMTANASIVVSKLDNASIVPVAALQWRPAAGAQIVGPDGQPLRRRGTGGNPAGGNTGAAGSNPGAQRGGQTGAQGGTQAGAQASGSPWGSTQGASSSAVVAGSRGRVYVSDGQKLRMVPVQIKMVSGTDAAVEPTRGGLNANDPVVVAGGSARARPAARAGTNPLGGGGRPGGGARIPGGR